MSAIPETISRSDAQPASRSRSLLGALPLAGFIIALLLLTGIPYLYGYLHASQERVFQGIAFNVADIVQYWSWMRDHHTALLVPNRMTSEPNQPALFNSLWLMLGQLQLATGWGNAAIYQFLRIAGGLAFLVVAWWFVGLFTENRRRRWASYLVITIGGGLGWVWVVDKYVQRIDDVRFPLDLYVVEPNGFFSLMALPHLLVAAAMILAIFGCFLIAEHRGDDWRFYAIAAITALALGLSHTYDLIMIYSVLGVYVLLQFVRARRILWGRFWGLAAVGFLSFPPAGYFTYLTSQNPLWKEVLAQFDNAGIFTPNLLHIWFLLGLPFIITVIYGISLLWHRATRPTSATHHQVARDSQCSMLNAQFLWVWVIVGFGLLYIPTDFQIKMLNPYQVPLALLAVQAICGWLDRRPKGSFLARHATLVLAVFVLATLPTNLYLLSWRVLELRRADAPFYLSQSQVAALEWLDTTSNEQAVVLSGLEVGQYLPAVTGHRAFLSHWAQTVQFFVKRDAVAQFFNAATTSTARHDLLQQYQVRYIVYGPEEKRLGAFDPASDSALQPVFRDQDTTVFLVMNR